MDDLTQYVSADCAEKVVQGLMKLCNESIKKERLKNMNIVVELTEYLYPLLTEEQNEEVKKMTDKILN